MERILVLGGSGFLGRHIVAALSGGGNEVVALSRHALGRSGGVPTVVADLTGVGAIRAVLAAVEPTLIVNAAGATTGSAADLRRANATLVRDLLDAMPARGAPRLVHIGSSAEYGRTEPGVPILESTPAEPVAEYGRTKLTATRAILEASPTATVFRVFNPVGAGAPPASLLGSAMIALRRTLAEAASEVVLGPLDASRDFIHVADVADAVAAAVRSAASAGILNVGSGEATLARELVRELTMVAGFTGVVREEAPAVRHRSAEVPWQQADIEQARRVLGWAPRRSWRGAVREAWEAWTSP